MGVSARHAPRPNRNVTSDVPVRPSPLDRPSQPPERAPLRSRSNAPRSQLGLESTRPGWPDAERTAFTEKPGSASRLDTPPGRSRAPSGTPAASEPYAQRLSYASTLDSGPRADGARSHAGAALSPLADSARAPPAASSARSPQHASVSRPRLMASSVRCRSPARAPLAG